MKKKSPPKGETLSYKPRAMVAQVALQTAHPVASFNHLTHSSMQVNSGAMQSNVSMGSILAPVSNGITTPIIFSNGQAYQLQGQLAIPIAPHEITKLMQMGAIAQVSGHAAPLSNGRL